MKKLFSASLLAVMLAVPGFAQNAPKTPPPGFMKDVQKILDGKSWNARMESGSSDEYKSSAVVMVSFLLRKDAAGKWVSAPLTEDEKILCALIEKEYYPLQRKSDLRSFADLYTEDAVITDSSGEKLTRKELLLEADALKALADGNLLEYMTLSSRLMGHEMDAEEMRKIKEMRGTDEEKEILAEFRAENNREEMSDLFGAMAVKTLRIESVKVTGDRGELSETILDPNGKTVRTRYQFVKKDGRWLIAGETAEELD